ncbi:uncharacterized protein LOC115621155 isoform X2 [Scaptodrosophila lebanonensis]|uniref:Uncharacterized protein LOC115621155 isoform X2 n=1 Tax=Drosophila lebanonensis TaxID=7225 RepID=A0A6J2T3L9_DROLE|nr:uncharacterized protein LOC115621155 isoform X2 [Scaptodrosophila lebanonensis]
MAMTVAGSKYPVPKALTTVASESNVDPDEEEEDEDSAETGSTTSFSLQECINEFRARRIRRVSTQSRDQAMPAPSEKCEHAPVSTSADADLIQQNRCNKAQERKSKPCKNGFCYCFNSDSGDCASIAPTRESHVRQQRRSRRSESSKTMNAQPPEPQQPNNLDRQQKHRRQSVPPNVKLSTSRKSPLTAVSSLCAVEEDAPLIHIIQELRDNCVISEVRVNKQKLQSTASPTKQLSKNIMPLENTAYKPTAPALSIISEQETEPEKEDTQAEHTDRTENTGSIKSTSSARHSSVKRTRRSSAAGRLLQKRLSHGQVNFKPRDVAHPPPKPPRRSAQSLDGKFSLSSLSSTTPSVREAERVVDEFLSKHGVHVPSASKDVENYKSNKSRSSTRKSYPLSELERKSHRRLLPTCPSLSDIERTVESKRGVHYAKNIHSASQLHRKNAVADKPMKEIMLGWTEPKINDMLNYDENANNNDKQQKFKTSAPEPAPQSAVGWQVPHKISLDTVDGPMSENLAVNMEQKHTPIKYPRANKATNQKFVWGEQWRTLSPWNGKKRGQKSISLRKKSKSFINNSKNRILRFVSPKKTNQQPVKVNTRLCTVGVQTSHLDLHTLSSQSPPGSYHSPVQSCVQHTLTTNSSATTVATTPHLEKLGNSHQPYFDFERTVKPPTPPKKVQRAQRGRKLEFNADCSVPPTTYRSYHKDLDQDVSINKMGYVLSSIRAKLEASDERAFRTFRECSRFSPLECTQGNDEGFDCPDSHRTAALSSRKIHEQEHEPIYSEIEEDCLHIRGSPHYESRTAARFDVIPTPTNTVSTVMVSRLPNPTASAQTVQDLGALYAKVQKPLKTHTQTTTMATPTPLGQFLHESLKNGSFFQFTPLPAEPETASSYSASILPTTPSPLTPQTHGFSPRYRQPSKHQSLNNIHEQHSPPKQNRNISKSELSLQRSEIFLENLCRSELVLDQDNNARLEKVENTPMRAKSTAEDSVSYDLPHEFSDELYHDFIGNDSCYTAPRQSQYSSTHIEPLASENQSTPKKHSPRFTTKPTRALSLEIADHLAGSHSVNVSISCPTTPQQAKPVYVSEAMPVTRSLGELTPAAVHSESQVLSISAMARYRLLKNALRRSYRKGKDFFRAEKQRLAQSFNLPRDQCNQTEGGELDNSTSSQYASFNLDTLMNDSLSTNEQLAQAVNICRQMPELEISPEMVEAERLLLFSTLRQNVQPLREDVMASQRQPQCFLIDAMVLPVKADGSQDMFFNYYYICTFECEGRITSTQSVECQNGEAVFRDCGIEFYSRLEAEALELRCQIFMLRLRKVSTLSLEPQKSVTKRGSLGSAGSSNSSTSGCDQIVSRFRLHASFTLRASDMIPYQVVTSETQQSSQICLRTSHSWRLPIIVHTKSTNLAPQITLTGRAELRLPKLQYAGYLNVQDTKNKHNWNRRWCTLLGLQMDVWQYEENLTEQPPLLALGLQNCPFEELKVAPRELCARARSFMIQCDESDIYYFATDTQSELNEWLLHLNEALEIVKRWLRA